MTIEEELYQEIKNTIFKFDKIKELIEKGADLNYRPSKEDYSNKRSH